MHRFLLSFRFLSLSVITYVFNEAKRGSWEQGDKQGAVHESGSFRWCPVGDVLRASELTARVSFYRTHSGHHTKVQENRM